MSVYMELLNLVKGLNAAGVEYALCGGLAVVVYGYARMTKDIDVLVRREDLERARSVARDCGFTVDSGLIPFGVGTEKEHEIYRVLKVLGPDILTLDFVLVAPIYDDVWEGRETVEWEGSRMQIVSLEGLAKMKRLAGRTQDMADLEQLGLPKDEGHDVQEKAEG